ncbi:regulatory protein, luxR family [Mucilaginibacter pineti]|uniref:Regulatory protein, luxR family n=1 Tax=Mucilaginibacter pineti TaxID=1391627 RepID=A0A1G7ETM7_9SPHI|nr:LuxR family transcriptional regulator [Mucilaginibacter pineti]SDE66989.1 regulatory protein, luxR family [Mucilaginibacter pineti]
MLVFNSEMHLLTFVFVVLEMGMLFFYQLPHYLSKPDDTSRLWYLILLALLVLYNVTGGLFPDPEIPIPIIVQNIIAYGSGFLMASYFPYFFYRGLGLEKLRFHALFGVPIFLILPYLFFFGLVYAINGDLEFAIHWGMVIPFIYSVVIVVAILNAIRANFNEQEEDGYSVTKTEAIALYCAVAPWVCMTLFAYFHVCQWIEVLCTNLGFVLITIIFISHSVKRDKIRERLLRVNAEMFDVLTVETEELFLFNCRLFKISDREVEIIRLVQEGLTNKEIADRIFRSEKTVGNHLMRIYSKTGAKTRTALINILLKKQV